MVSVELEDKLYHGRVKLFSGVLFWQTEMVKWDHEIRFQYSAVCRKAVNWEEVFFFLSVASQGLALIRWHGFVWVGLFRR